MPDNPLVKLGRTRKDSNMRKAILVAVAALITCPNLVRAQQQQKSGAGQETRPVEQLPSVDQILSRHMQALGGKAAIEKLTSLTLTGTMEVPSAGLSGKAELAVRAPNRYFLSVDIEGVG